MKPKRFEKKGISFELLADRINRMKHVLLKRNAEIRKIMKEDFKSELVLKAQREFEAQVKEFEIMIKENLVKTRKRTW